MDIISTYSRKQAIEDGVLVDLTGVEGTEPYKYPVAFTAALWAEVERGQGRKCCGTRTGRIWDICWMSTTLKKQLSPTTVAFRVKVGRRVLSLLAECGPADDLSPCITIGFPEDF